MAAREGEGRAGRALGVGAITHLAWAAGPWRAVLYPLPGPEPVAQLLGSVGR